MGTRNVFQFQSDHKKQEAGEFYRRLPVDISPPLTPSAFSSFNSCRHRIDVFQNVDDDTNNYNDLRQKQSIMLRDETCMVPEQELVRLLGQNCHNLVGQSEHIHGL